MQAPMLALAVCLAPTAEPSDSVASERVVLTWRAPDGCPTVSEVLRRVDRFATPPTGELGTRAQATIDVAADGAGGYRLILVMRFDEGEVRRVVEASACDEAADAAALIVSVLLDPQALLAELEAGESANAEADPAAPPNPVAERAEDPATDREPEANRDAPPKRGAFVRLSGTGAFGDLPGLGGGPTLAAGWDRGRLRLEGRSFLDAPQRGTLADAGAGARFSAWSFGAAACFVPARGAFAFPLCLGPELGWIRAVGEGLVVVRTADRVLARVAGGPAITWAPLPWLALRAEVDGLVALTRPRFVIDDLGVLHQPRAAGVRFGGGLELRISRRAGSSRTSAR